MRFDGSIWALIIAVAISYRVFLLAMNEGIETVQSTDRKGDRAESYMRETEGRLIRFKEECS